MRLGLVFPLVSVVAWRVSAGCLPVIPLLLGRCEWGLRLCLLLLSLSSLLLALADATSASQSRCSDDSCVVLRGVVGVASPGVDPQVIVAEQPASNPPVPISEQGLLLHLPCRVAGDKTR